MAAELRMRATGPAPCQNIAQIRRFRALVCELLQLPADLGDRQFRAALRAHGPDSVKWYETRIAALAASESNLTR